MTPPTRGARDRRAARRPGWQLLTVLLVLAIAASASLVFTSRVELLRLAVILSLWAAVLAAFVSVTYRRQSEVDQARARDMKHVYDLQLDREITARREYELNVETQLRRQLSREIRAQAADEMTALRAELAALRANLEVMLGTDLQVRPALEAEPVIMAMPAPPGRVQSSRVNPVTADAVVTVTETVVVESSIIDVPEEPLTPAPPPPPPPPPPPAPVPVSRGPRPPGPPPPPWRPPETAQGRHRTMNRPQPGPPSAPVPEVPQPDPGPDAVRGRHRGESVVPAGRHRTEGEAPIQAAEQAGGEDQEPQGQHAGGQSFADLMAKLQVQGTPGGGGAGGRRRRPD